jgi:RHS repeat-associated protein
MTPSLRPRRTECIDWDLRDAEFNRRLLMQRKYSHSVVWFFILAGLCVRADLFAAERGDDNPTGVAGIFNGNITTGCSYDPHTGNGHRAIDDIVVPGAVGSYPLKWTRYWNSRGRTPHSPGKWTYSYIDYADALVEGPHQDPEGGEGPEPRLMFLFPDGRALDFTDGDSVPGVEDRLVSDGLLQADGGKVLMGGPAGETANGAQITDTASQIIDPYGHATTIVTTGSGTSKTTKITEPAPGGRYLLVSYNSNDRVHEVKAFDGINAQQPIAQVTYYYGNSNQIEQVDYHDGSFATYTYREVLFNDWPATPPNDDPPPIHAWVVETARDPRHPGPMHDIFYDYQYRGQGNARRPRILSENHLLPDGTAGELVTRVTDGGNVTGAEETRGDGPKRGFTYHRGSGGVIPDPLAGKLLHYTDFYTSVANARTTYVTYEESGLAAGFIKTVKDFNGHITTYTRSTFSWGITRITHPATVSEPQGAYIQQEFTDEANPYFLKSRTDENLKKTSFTRDDSANPNAITRKDYPDNSYETFAYNSFGQMTTHRMKNGAYEYFDYDTRGLLLTKTNPTWNANRTNSLASDPRTTYTYYTINDFGGAWTDRVKTETDPRGMVTQYEYDRYLTNNENSGASTGEPCAGRGLVTKIKHVSDNNNYELFGFDKYGNKVWEENELHKRTAYQYDDFNRLVSVTDPLSHQTLHSYVPADQPTTSSYIRTLNQPWVTTLVTSPVNEVTNFFYDLNWRKKREQRAPGTSIEATTYFGYDYIGNPTYVTDPRGQSDGDSAYTTTTDYDQRDRKWHVTDPQGHQTIFGYDPASNIASITRSDGTIETKLYDEVNRVRFDIVPKDGTPQNVSETVTTEFRYYPGTSATMAGELQYVIDGKSQTSTFEYDASGQKTKMTYPNNVDYQSWTYDADKNVIARRTVNDASQYFTYDNRNRPSSMSWSNTADWANFGYDAVGRMTSAENPNSTVTREYDDAGRLTHDRQKPRLQPVSAVSRKVHGTGPDATPCEIVLPLTGPAGVECRAPGPYNSHQIVVMFPRAVTFSAASVTAGATILGTPVISAGGKQVTIDLTNVNNGQLVVVTLSGVNDGTITNDVKIGMAVLLGDVNGNGYVNSSDVSQVQFESGHALTKSNFRNDVTLSNSINSSDVSTVQAQSGTGSSQVLPAQPLSTAPEVDVQYVYNNSNRQTGLSVPGAGYNYTFGYDTMGRFETISTGGTLNFQYGYDKASNEVLRRRATGGASSTQFDQVYIPDELNRVTRRNLVRAGSMVAYEIYDYDPSRPGLMTSVTRWQPGQNPNQDIFGYDLLPELSSAQYGLQQGTGNGGEEPIGVLDPIALRDGSKEGGGEGGSEKLIEPDPNLQWVQPQRTVDYTWDKAGNRSNMNENITGGASTSCAYQVTNLNQYSQAGNDAVINGNHHELTNYQNTAYSYINDTHLCAITGDSHTYQLSYDALGRCVVRMFDGVTNYYIYDGEKAILEYSTGYNLLAANLYGRGIDEILMRTDYSASPARTWYYQDDHEGSITQLTDGNGNIVETYRYDAFGKPAFWNGDNPPRQIEGSNYNNRFLFTGREYMATFGIYEYRNRAYHPGLGRFMSEDPKLFDAGDYNLFRYCANDPLDKTDPMGLFFGWDDAAFAAGGAAVGLGSQAFQDVISGQLSGWQAYTGAAIGGAVGGLTLEYTGNPVAAGAAAAFVGDATTQGLQIASGNQKGFSPSQLASTTLIGAATGAIPGPRVAGLNAGRNSYNAIARQMQTKMAKGIVQRVAPATAAKVAVGRLWDSGAVTGVPINGAANFASRSPSHTSTGGMSGGRRDGMYTLHPVQVTARADGSDVHTTPDSRDMDVVMHSQ